MIFALEEFIYQFKNRKCKDFLFRTRGLHTSVFLHSFLLNFLLLHLSSCPLQPTVTYLKGNRRTCWTSYPGNQSIFMAGPLALSSLSHPPSSHYSPTCYLPELSVKPSMDCIGSPHQCSFLCLISGLLFIINLCSCLHQIFSTFRLFNPWGCLNFKFRNFTVLR